MGKPQFTMARLLAVIASIACALAIMKAYREAFGVSWQWAASVAVIVSAPLVVTVTFGTWADVVRVLIVLLPPAIVGIINPCGIILAVPAGWVLLGFFNLATKRTFWN